MHDLPGWYREKHSKELEDYWLALGEFTDAFAAIEAAMFDYLHKLSGTSNAVSRALFSGVRIDAAMKYITRLLIALKATDQEKQKAEFAFTQLGHINKVRNDVIHYGTNYASQRRRGSNDPMEYLVSNKEKALNKSRLRETPISARILRQMTSDLWKIHIHLYACMAKGLPSEIGALETFEPTLRAPWRYKPQQQASRGGKNRPKPRKPKPRPQS